MQVISAQEWQLTSFFEVVPTYPFADDPWPYTEVVYELQRDGLSLSCAIHPSHRDVRIILKKGTDTLYELNAVAVHDVAYIGDPGGETLRVDLTEQESLLLRVSPHIQIAHEAYFGP